MNFNFPKAKTPTLIRAMLLLLALVMCFAFPVPASAAGYQENALPAYNQTHLLTESASFIAEPGAGAVSALPVSVGHNMAARSMRIGAPVMLTHVNATIDMDTLFGGIVDIIIKMASYVGMILVIGGIFQLILAYKDDNADSQSKAIRYIVVGASLMGLRIFLVMAGIIA